MIPNLARFLSITTCGFGALSVVPMLTEKAMAQAPGL